MCGREVYPNWTNFFHFVVHIGYTPRGNEGWRTIAIELKTLGLHEVLGIWPQSGRWNNACTLSGAEISGTGCHPPTPWEDRCTTRLPK